MSRKTANLFSPKDFLIILAMATLLVVGFVAVYFVRNPRQVRPGSAKSYVTTCNSSTFPWDPTKTFTIDMDDTYYGALTDQYLSSGPLFDYNMTQGVGLNKVSVNNTLNPGNGYAATISSDSDTFPNPISSPVESSMILKFPEPVETVSFQMQYGEPFDLTDTNRDRPDLWGIDFKIYVRNNDGTDTMAMSHAWDLTVGSNVLTMIPTTLKNVCYTIGWNKLISRIDVLVPAAKHTKADSYPPDKLTLDNFKLQVPKGWTPPTSGTTEPTPTPTQSPTNDPGTCVCLPNGRVKYDYCNYDYQYSPVCYSSGCECVR